MKTTRQMPSFQGVAASQTATLLMPRGLTYHGLLISYAGVTLAQMTEFRLKINGRPMFAQSAVDIDTSNKFDGLAAANGILYFPFDRPNLKTRQGIELTAIGTGLPFNNDAGTQAAPNPFYNPTPIDTIQLEIDIAAGAVAPVLSAKAIQSAPRPTGAIIKRRKFNYTTTGAGDYEISDLPKGDLINKIWIKQANGVLTQVKLERDNFISFERNVAENSLIQADGVRVPQSDWFVIDPTEQGFGAEAIVTAVNDFRLKLTTSGAETFTIYVDYIGGLGGN